MSFELLTVPCLSDNYAFLAHDDDSKMTLLVDAPEADPILAILQEKQWSLSHVLLTHHHWDHVDGLPQLLEFHSPQIIGSAADLKRLPPLHLPVTENDKIQIGGNEGIVFDTPGHTIGHISVYFEASKLLFSADTLMALGCGRLFEGTAEQMWHSLQKLSKLPDDTLVCSGHEYTEKNADFALTIDPKNQELVNRVQFTKKIRAEGVPTVPSSLGEEKKTNPFLRPWNKNIRTKIGMLDATDEEVFGKIRALKDAY
jgi:hydroxyacylglutathione hydrolase